MNVNSVSTAFTTDKIEESKDFYVKYLNATVIFDCGWYVNLQLGSEFATVQFMSPQKPEHALSNGSGLMYNCSVEDVDHEYERLMGLGLTALMPLEDHPWGDRGFSVQDPNGIMVYIYSDREPSEEFKQYFKA